MDRTCERSDDSHESLSIDADVDDGEPVHRVPSSETSFNDGAFFRSLNTLAFVCAFWPGFSSTMLTCDVDGRHATSTSTDDISAIVHELARVTRNAGRTHGGSCASANDIRAILWGTATGTAPDASDCGFAPGLATGLPARILRTFWRFPFSCLFSSGGTSPATNDAVHAGSHGIQVLRRTRQRTTLEGVVVRRTTACTQWGPVRRFTSVLVGCSLGPHVRHDLRCCACGPVFPVARLLHSVCS